MAGLSNNRIFSNISAFIVKNDFWKIAKEFREPIQMRKISNLNYNVWIGQLYKHTRTARDLLLTVLLSMICLATEFKLYLINLGYLSA